MGPVIITAVLKAKQGNEQKLYEELIKVASASQQEEGCTQYRLHQSIEDGGLFVLYESYRDEESLQLHIDSPHYKGYRETIQHLIETREVHKLGQII
ncbi:putative quinol monooxygenase [Fictibacillus iocasae]|uniref:Quinol monooxygenase n=1 Tax=Fictibacillus iocasae TaxID=2715437 RepID=A0ABW2NPB6_9BACL